MMNDSIRKLIDSCRPQGDDLSQPEMQPLADLIADDASVARRLDRSRQLDCTITDAVQDVPTPAGLEQRILAALAESAAVSTEAQSVSDGEPSRAAKLDLPADLTAGRTHGDESDVVLPRTRSDSWRRRWWVPVATCTAIFFVIMAVKQQWPSQINYQDLVSAAMSWEVNEDDWLDGNVIWKNHPLPKEIRVASVARRQKFRLPKYNVMARCYDLNLKDRGKARIFVFAKTRDFALPATPPDKPMFTLGKCVAAWNSADFVYVMVVEGTEETYERAIRRAMRI